MARGTTLQKLVTDAGPRLMGTLGHLCRGRGPVTEMLFDTGQVQRTAAVLLVHLPAKWEFRGRKVLPAHADAQHTLPERFGPPASQLLAFCLPDPGARLHAPDPSASMT